jgi:hypothetical protein
MASPILYEEGDCFPVLDLIALFRFKTASSVSFHLGTQSGTLYYPPDGVAVPFGPGEVFNVIGWVDVHHPCDDHIKARLRVLLPARYHDWKQMKQLVETMFSALGIPADQTYEASFVSADQETGIERATDRDGMTDRLY